MFNIVTAKKAPMRGLYVDEIPGINREDDADVLGYLEFSIEFSMSKNEIKIGIVQATELVCGEDNDGMDAYVKVYLLMEPSELPLDWSPSDRKMSVAHTTHIKYEQMHPCWSEIFTFRLKYDDIRLTYIKFEVYDYEKMNIDNNVGELEIPLKDLNISSIMGRTLELVKPIGPGTVPYRGFGEVCTIMNIDDVGGIVNCKVVEIRQMRLIKNSAGQYPPTMMQIEVFLGNKRIGSKKSEVRYNSCDAHFNVELVKTFKPEKLHKLSVVLTCYWYNVAKLKTVLGKILLSAESSHLTGQDHFLHCLRNVRCHIPKWHHLEFNGSIQVA